MLLTLDLWKHHVHFFRVCNLILLFTFQNYKNLNIISFHILGGHGWTRSNASFLFSLRDSENLAPFIANVVPGNEQYAIYCHPGYGPTFGGGHDIYIADNANGNRQSYSNLAGYYRVHPRTRTRNALLAGSENFTPTEIEVFI